MDGFYWKGYGFSKNVIQVATNPSNYPDNEKIEGRFQR